MKKRITGILICVMALFVFISLVQSTIKVRWLINELMIDYGGNCIVNGKCIHERNLYPLYIGILGTLFLFSFGIYLIFFDKTKHIIENKRIEIPKNLDEEEKKIMDILNSKEGGCYQSDLIKETNFSKVKITRVLDKLETKRLIERKRRGMTNIVVLK